MPIMLYLHNDLNEKEYMSLPLGFYREGEYTLPATANTVCNCINLYLDLSRP